MAAAITDAAFLLSEADVDAMIIIPDVETGFGLSFFSSSVVAATTTVAASSSYCQWVRNEPIGSTNC